MPWNSFSLRDSYILREEPRMEPDGAEVEPSRGILVSLRDSYIWREEPRMAPHAAEVEPHRGAIDYRMEAQGDRT